MRNFLNYLYENIFNACNWGFHKYSRGTITNFVIRGNGRNGKKNVSITVQPCKRCGKDRLLINITNYKS